MKNRKYSRRLSWIFLAIFLSLGILAACIQNKGSASSTPLTEVISQGELSQEQIATLSSLKKVDDYPLYTMRYYGAYSQSSSSKDDPRYATNPPKSDLKLFLSPWACSLFTSLANTDNMLYGRNFDWKFSPAVLLFTDPPDRYASVSMVDIDYLGFGEEKSESITDLSIDERRTLLKSPLIPFDGMNEHGLVVGMAAVPPGYMRPDPKKTTIGSLGVIRKILDHANNVDEAIAIFKNYNINMEEVPIHYLIAAPSGDSALVEFYNGEMVVTRNDKPWHSATNFLIASVSQFAIGNCNRYDKINHRLTEVEGRLTKKHAMDLLADVSVGHTQWSIVYGMNTGDIEVSMGRHYRNLHRFHINVGDN
jgi:hypothetical protein